MQYFDIKALKTNLFQKVQFRNFLYENTWKCPILNLENVNVAIFDGDKIKGDTLINYSLGTPKSYTYAFMNQPNIGVPVHFNILEIQIKRAKTK